MGSHSERDDETYQHLWDYSLCTIWQRQRTYDRTLYVRRSLVIALHALSIQSSMTAQSMSNWMHQTTNVMIVSLQSLSNNLARWHRSTTTNLQEIKQLGRWRIFAFRKCHLYQLLYLVGSSLPTVGVANEDHVQPTLYSQCKIMTKITGRVLRLVKDDCYTNRLSPSSTPNCIHMNPSKYYQADMSTTPILSCRC